jgi:hypothetical protein
MLEVAHFSLHDIYSNINMTESGVSTLIGAFMGVKKGLVLFQNLLSSLCPIDCVEEQRAANLQVRTLLLSLGLLYILL